MDLKRLAELRERIVSTQTAGIFGDEALELIRMAEAAEGDREIERLRAALRHLTVHAERYGSKRLRRILKEDLAFARAALEPTLAHAGTGEPTVGIKVEMGESATIGEPLGCVHDYILSDTGGGQFEYWCCSKFGEPRP
jgi:hypothetical protein